MASRLWKTHTYAKEEENETRFWQLFNFLSVVYLLFFNELFSDPVILWVKLVIFCPHCQQIQLKRPTLSVTDDTNRFFNYLRLS